MRHRNKTSEYYGVSRTTKKTGDKGTIEWGKNHPWKACVKKNKKSIIEKVFATEIEAAKAVDLALIRAGYEPVNILVRKNG